MSAHVDFAFLRAVRDPKRQMSSAARHVAMLVCLHADHGACHLDRETIAAETSLGARTVRRACRELIEQGWLAEERRPGQPRWTLAIPPLEATRKAQADRREKPRLEPVERREKLKLTDAKGPGLEREKPNLLLSGSTPKKPQESTPRDQTRARGSSEGSQEQVQKLPPKGATLALPGIEAPPSKPFDPLQAPEVTEVLEHWRSRGYHTRKPIDSPERRKRIRDRLDEGIASGVTLAEHIATLKAALDGASIDEYLMGRHDRNNASSGGKVYNGVETILRDAAQVEKLATLWDVALAEGRVHPDGGDRQFDRFGQPRRRAPAAPVATAADGAAAPSGPDEYDRQFKAFAEKIEARKRALVEADERAEAARRAALTNEVRAEEDVLLGIARRSQKRMQEQEARDELERERSRARRFN